MLKNVFRCISFKDLRTIKVIDFWTPSPPTRTLINPESPPPPSENKKIKLKQNNTPFQ